MAFKPPSQFASARQSAAVSLDTNAWFTPGRFAAFLGSMLVAGWPQVLIGWETFFYVDYATFGYPLAYYHRASIWNGEFPLWNPLNNCGTPFLAQWNTLTVYPFSLIYLLLPLPWSLAIYCLAHLYVAGMGMYTLAWRWSGNRFAAAAAGAVFAFNGLTWFGLMWPNNIAALGWMPWVVLTVERGWRDGKGWVVGGSLVAACQILAGAPEVTFLTWLFIGALWLVLLVRGEISRPKLLLRSLALSLLTTGLTAAQMFPFLDLLAHSQRNTSYGDPSIMAMPLWGWANYVVPLFHLIKTRQGMYFQIHQAWTASYYVGIVTVALATFAVARLRGARMWLLLGVTLFSLLMSLGAPGKIYSLVSAVVPAMNFMRFPIKFVVLATFTVPLLAALGAASWLRNSDKARDLRWLGGIAALFSFIAVALVLWARIYPVEGENPNTTTWNGALRVLFLGAFLGGLLLLKRERDGRLHIVWQTALILLLWFDVYTHSANLSPTVPSRVLEPGIIREFFGWQNELHHGESRAMQGRRSFWRMLADSSADPEVDVHGRRLSLFFNLNLLDAVPKVDGFFSLEVREFSDIFRQLYFGPKEAEPLKRFLGISHLSNPTNSVDWLRNPSSLPLITAGQKPEFVSNDESLELVFADSFDPLKTVYLPLESQTSVKAAGAATVQLSNPQILAHRIVARAVADAPALVVIAQAHYHPWCAYIDGQRVPIHRANHAFQAVEIPVGTHHLELRYEDRAFTLGLWITSLSTLLCVALAIHFARPRPKTPAPNTARRIQHEGLGPS